MQLIWPHKMIPGHVTDAKKEIDEKFKYVLNV